MSPAALARPFAPLAIVFGVGILACLPLAPTRTASGAEEDREEERRITERNFQECLQYIAAARKSGDLPELAHWAGQLGDYDSVKAVQVALGLGEEYPMDPVRGAVSHALRQSDSVEVFAYYQKELENVSAANLKRAFLIVEALSFQKGPVATESLTGLLFRIRDARVLATIVRALKKLPEKSTVESLIRFYKAIEGNKDTLWQETRLSLLALTGESFALAADWEKWWLTYRDSWQPPSKGDSDDERARTRVFRPESPDLDLPILFGQEIASKRVVFVLDTSKSMLEEDELEGPESGSKELRVRMLRAKRELSKVVSELRSDVEFNLITYDTALKCWQERKLLRASEANKRDAVKFVDALKADGTTSTELAMMEALQVEGVDTIVLLSDGSPTDPKNGKVIEWEPILDKIRAENRFKRIAIHTLGFKGANVEFMKRLARQNYGTYSSIR